MGLPVISFTFFLAQHFRHDLDWFSASFLWSVLTSHRWRCWTFSSVRGEVHNWMPSAGWKHLLVTLLNMRGYNMRHCSTLLNSYIEKQSTCSNSDYIWQGSQGRSCNQHWHPFFKHKWFLVCLLYLHKIVKVQGLQSFIIFFFTKTKMECFNLFCHYWQWFLALKFY